jgi:hypothetical protein
LERALRYNAEVKERLSREQANSLDLTTQLGKSQADLLTIVDITENLEAKNGTYLIETQRITQEKIEVEIRLADVAALLSKANIRIAFMESLCSSTETERDSELHKVLGVHINALDFSYLLP